VLWAKGGATRLANLTALCRRHHVAIHEQGFRVMRDRDGAVVFTRPDGTRLDAIAPPPRWIGPQGDPLQPTTTRLAAAGISIGPHSAAPHWGGEPFDVGWAIDVLRAPRVSAPHAR
jgi:hypothetical protein